MALRTPANPLARHLAALTSAQRSSLDTDTDLRAAFEAGIEPFLPKPIGVSWGQEDRWVPVSAVFDNAERTVRFARRERGIAA